MREKGISKLNMIICTVLAVCVLILIWFIVPYSPLKMEFSKKYGILTDRNNKQVGSFSPEILADKPKLLQDYIDYCGLTGQPMMHHSVTTHHKVDFLMESDKPMIKIDYIQANLTNSPERIAFIDTKMAGFLPFQGLDDYIEGKARMQGIIGKLFTLFDVQNPEMNQSALVTVLAEAPVCPSFLMHDDIVWKAIDSTHLEATLTQYGITVSGIFEFDENGAIVSFYTKDRYQESNGVTKQLDWIARCGGYEEVDGIKRPTSFQGAWILADGTEQIYFDCNNVEVKFYY